MRKKCGGVFEHKSEESTIRDIALAKLIVYIILLAHAMTSMFAILEMSTSAFLELNNPIMSPLLH